jgi:paraquat-inducible protein A
MSTRNWIAVGLTLVSLAVIVPGLRSDALTITATIPLLKKPIYEETQSILRAIQRLYDSKNYFVAGLVLLFSVIVPFIKAALLAVILKVRNPVTKYRLYLLVRSMSKWAMADVFAVGIFIAFMAGNAIDNLDAKLHPGFYYFIAYCLISNLSFQFLHVPPALSDVEGPPDQAPTAKMAPV